MKGEERVVEGEKGEVGMKEELEEKKEEVVWRVKMRGGRQGDGGDGRRGEAGVIKTKIKESRRIETKSDKLDVKDTL